MIGIRFGESKSKNGKVEKIAYSLSEREKEILKYILENKRVEEIVELTNFDETTVKKAMLFLENKGIIKIKYKPVEIVELDKNGVIYLKNGLPERILANVLVEKGEISFDEIKELSKQELNIAIGELKKLDLIEIEGQKIRIKNRGEAIKKFPQEKFLEELPKEKNKLSDEEKEILKNLIKRKEIVKIDKKIEIDYESLPLAKEVFDYLSSVKQQIIESLTPEILKNKSWKKKKFKYYDVKSKVPQIYYGKRNFYLYFLERVREKLVSYGFKEMEDGIVVNEFWNFDALFQPQHHMAREWSDTYYLRNQTFEIPIPKEVLKRVKEVHEEKWKYKWDEKKARNIILRPQGTVLSAITLYKNSKRIGEFLKNAKEKTVFEKYFSIAKVFRPDIVDATHLTEFNQLEGIIIGYKLSFSNLLAWLEQLTKEISSAKEVIFKPDYFPFTEPSVEISIKVENKILEVGGAGIFREEVVKPLLGENYKDGLIVLAWGLGIDRLVLAKYKLNDIRLLFTRNLKFLREIPL
jgi:phenylalanyl-tRNA synthetase alpha chain